MGAILHKLCEKSEQELWDLLKEPEWTKDHAEVAFYMMEIMKGVKKIEHLKKLDEAMDEYDWQEEMMEHQEGKHNKSEFARGGNRGGGRGSGGRNNYARYTTFGMDEEHEEGMGHYARRMNNYNHNAPSSTEWEDRQFPPTMYAFTTDKNKHPEFNSDHAAAKYYEGKYRELLEDKWEKEKKEKEEKQSSSNRMPPPPPK